MPRHLEPREKLESFTAHRGKCRYCGGPVVMLRGEKAQLLPNRCWCISCGQGYYLEISDIDAWEKEQWRQKGEKE